MKIRIVSSLALLTLFAGCGGDDSTGPGGGGNDLPGALVAAYGSYDLTYTVTTTKADGASAVKIAGATLEISASEPGVMGVDAGTVVPGVDPADVIFGAVYVQNPAHVFIGSDTQGQAGDFCLWSSVRYGLPADAAELEFTGCEGEGGPFACSPQFFQSAELSGSVNLVYLATGVAADGEGDLEFTCTLIDDHRSEASDINMFDVQTAHDILGPGAYAYCFDEGAVAAFTVSDGAVSGTLTGTGWALEGSDPYSVSISIAFGGAKRR